jgi:hypothetical protein
MLNIPICKFDFSKADQVQKYVFSSQGGFDRADFGDYVDGSCLHRLFEHINLSENRRRHPVELHIKYTEYTSDIFVEASDGRTMPYGEYAGIVEQYKRYFDMLTELYMLEDGYLLNREAVFPEPPPGIIKEWHTITRKYQAIKMTRTSAAVIPYARYIKYTKYLQIVAAIQEMVETIQTSMMIKKCTRSL